MFDPEESAALCSESPDEDALILGHGLFIVLVRWGISLRREKRGQVRTDRAKMTVAIFYVSANVAPEKLRTTVSEILGVQRY